MEKSVDAFRTISEVADDLDLPQHVLRFWETRFTQIRPLKRAGGRRYYRPADVLLLRNIRQLLYDEGYTIKGVQRLLRDKGSRGLRDEAAASDTDDVGADQDGRAAEPVSPAPATSTPETTGARAHRSIASEQDRADLRETLGVIDTCERILREALEGHAEGKRLQPDDGSL